MRHCLLKQLKVAGARSRAEVHCMIDDAVCATRIPRRACYTDAAWTSNGDCRNCVGKTKAWPLSSEGHKEGISDAADTGRVFFPKKKKVGHQ